MTRRPDSHPAVTPRLPAARLRRWLRAAALATGALSLAAACSDDEPMPPYCQALAELKTGADGCARRLITDDGDTAAVTNRPGGLRPDTTYRVTALYVRTADGVELHGATAIPAPLPRRYAPDAILTDPVRLDALWRGGRYLNMRITMQTEGEPHVLGFIDQGLEEHADGTRTLRITLLHSQHDNALYFPREATLSCPLWPYAGSLRAGTDSVRITIHTFDGPVERTFIY